MSKIFFISLNTETLPCPVYPLGVASVSGELFAEGHEVTMWDILMDGREGLSQAVTKYAPDFILCSIRNIDNTDGVMTKSYILDYKNVVEELRRVVPTVPLIIGGSGYSIFPERLDRELKPDLGVAGSEIEKVFDFINSKCEASEKTSPQMKSDYWMPSKRMYRKDLVSSYWKQSGMIGMPFKRGCPRHCIYCTYPKIEGRQVDVQGVDGVALEMEALYEEFGVDYFFFTDSVFNLQEKDELALAKILIKRKLPIRWGAFFSPIGLTKEYLEIMKASGLAHLELGSDSLVDLVLRKMAKGFKFHHIQETSALCHELDINIAHYLILGGPGESMDTLKEDVDKMKSMPNNLQSYWP